MWQANAASFLKRVMPAVSPTILAAVNSAQPGSASSWGATARTAVPMRFEFVDAQGEPDDVTEFVGGQLGE
ncbi:hypothetical protein MCHIJ_42780 [Mycolicibacterium chitae]|nr:hypothetical protein MCHIJ_42780 [Mycolicibacterium chitae]